MDLLMPAAMPLWKPRVRSRFIVDTVAPVDG